MRLAACIAAGALAASCATPAPVAPNASEPTPVAASGPPAGVSYAEDMVTYLARIRTMNDAALLSEAARMKRDASDLARVKAALAMTLSSQADEAEIIELVEPVSRKPGASDVRAMAALLNANAQERRRLKQRAINTAGELREERKLVEAQKQRAEQLQQKLDALTDLERSLATREAQTR